MFPRKASSDPIRRRCVGIMSIPSGIERWRWCLPMTPTVQGELLLQERRRIAVCAHDRSTWRGSVDPADSGARQEKHLTTLEKHWRLVARENPVDTLIQELAAI